MKTISRILLTASLSVTLGFSGIISGVSVIINDEPITLYEVYKYSTKYKISRKESLNILVRQKLEDAQIKKLRITADLFEVDQYIEKLATQNGMSQYEFLNMLKSKNIKVDDYKKELKAKIKKDKLYGSIYREKLVAIEESEIENFYKNNPKEFQVANSFNVTIYTTQNPQDLQAIQNNPMLQPQSVKTQDKILNSKELNNQLASLLNSTKEGGFTQISNIQNLPTMFYVREKNDITTLPFEKVKQPIYSVLTKQKEKKTIEDYFEKIKSTAAIKVIRNPS